jgi:hypothetical protein
VTLTVITGVGPGRCARADPGANDHDPGSFGIQLLDAPANRRDDPRARQSIVDHLAPGTVIRRRIVVVNKTEGPLRIDLYAGAAAIVGERFQPAVGRTPNELTSWISLEYDTVELVPWERREVRVTIAVPADASAGERYAAIWASVSSRADPSANVNTVHRVGIRVYLSVGPGGEPVSKFAIGELTPARDEHGVPSLAVQVRNTGERALEMTGRIRLTDGPAGMNAGPFDVGKGANLLPGETGTVLIRFPAELPNGPWRFQLDLASGRVEERATGTVSFPDAGRTGSPATLAASVAGGWGTGGLAALGGLLLLGGVAFVVRRTRAGLPAAGE